ncbi:hypothetical protein NW801_03950 [Brevibacillus laterosporus]|uniref:Transcription initiation factor TFIID n=2 Tax=Brevibacillus TaxID=55080 RepID=A0A0F7EGD1_BRELA|nr:MULTISPECIES: hypothetical protein [Brevibacillus]AKF93773.1 hypothetical protein EX87_09115 [Brevibacillus laterosporus]MCR8984234.1 hypothetical protein [Brevibacillus laterosporus]MCZ0829955.1 hypothetical protein [Brevibacillus halotolerans]
MRDLIEQFATHYVSDLEKQLDSENGQRSIQNPVLFLFLGDKSLEALQSIYATNEQKWQNSEGVLYVHAYSEDTLQRANVYNCRLPQPSADKKTMRASLYDMFYQDESLLIELNKMMKMVSVRVAEMGKLFTYHQQMNIAVVTRADDIANVLLPEFTLLVKSYLSELFKNVSLDLYVLIQEKNNGQEFGFSTSIGVSFLDELNEYQQPDYQFCADLQMTEDRVKLAVEHTSSPLYSLVYILSDKNEQGMFIDNGKEDNYELISDIVLLNNKRVESEVYEGSESYNRTQFIHNITGVTGRPTFASAGLSKVKRPTHAIAHTVLAKVYDHFLERLKQNCTHDVSEVLERLEITDSQILQKVKSVLPDESKLEEMTGLMTSGVSYKELTSMTLKEAEVALFEDSSQTFFATNFVLAARSKQDSSQQRHKLTQLIREEILENPKYGLYAAYQLTSGSDAKKSLANVLRSRIRDTIRQLEYCKDQLEDLYRQRVDRQEIKTGGLFTRDKERVRNFIRHFFPVIYGKKYEILGLEMEIELLTDYERQLEDIHQKLRQQVMQLEEIKVQVSEMSRKSIREAVDYLDKNIEEYYGAVVQESIEIVEAKRGTGFYFEDKYMGSISFLIDKGVTEMIQRLCDMCRKEIMTSEPFSLSFEDELLARANVTAAYDNRTVLTREQLYRDLALELESRSSVHIEVFQFMQKYRYEEKYFFADYTNDFVQYVFRTEQGMRTYKQGCIHEAHKSGIEKIKLMGGFGIEDLMYYRNNRKYYESYRENGFLFRRQGGGQLS